ncbi:MAG: hypothetical protein Q8M15_07170 [Bacteroidota bacterium]|nr:hypothetical protein [Bacteroidota bacterium]
MKLQHLHQFLAVGFIILHFNACMIEGDTGPGCHDENFVIALGTLNKFDPEIDYWHIPSSVKTLNIRRPDGVLFTLSVSHYTNERSYVLKNWTEYNRCNISYSYQAKGPFTNVDAFSSTAPITFVESTEKQVNTYSNSFQPSDTSLIRTDQINLSFSTGQNATFGLADTALYPKSDLNLYGVLYKNVYIVKSQNNNNPVECYFQFGKGIIGFKFIGSSVWLILW